MNFNFEYLKHGKALCGKAFKRFVETFNFHNEFIANLKGDADLTTEGGHVNVDTTEPSHPVIRCNGCGGGSSSGGTTSKTAPSPFEFTMVTPDPEEGEEEEPSETPAIVNNTFYWDGVLKSLSDFTPPATCTVYLCCTQAAPSSSGEAEWQFSIATSPAQATSGGRVVNYKLYDIVNNAVTCDYRTTFMTLESPHEKSSVLIKKPSDEYTSYVYLHALTDNDARAMVVSSGGSVDLRVTQSKASVAVESKTGKQVSINPDDIDKDGAAAQFHKLTVKHADPDEEDDIYYVLADSDITIREGAAEERLTGVELDLNGDTNLRLKLTFTDKDGNARDEYSTGLTLKQVDVVTGSSYSGMKFSNTKKNITVIKEVSASNEDVFTAVAHSSN